MANELALIKKDVVDVVEGRVKHFISDGSLHLPAGYSPGNAMKAAWLILQDTVDKDKRPVLTTCTKDSIANALLSMICQGLNPQKNQGYFLAYGSKLVFQRSYFGAMAMAKMVDPTIEDFPAEVVHAGDKLDVEIVLGKKHIRKHVMKQWGGNKKSDIIGAYCMVIGKNGEILDTVLMDIDEIKQSWRQSKQNPILDNGNIKAGTTHDKFTADMCKRTVINKACKPIINSSSDAALLNQFAADVSDVAFEADTQQHISENANTGPVLDFDNADRGGPDQAEDPKPPAAIPQEEQTNQEPTKEMVSCPAREGDKIMVEYCDTKCKSRPGCPAFDDGNGGGVEDMPDFA